MYSNVFPARVVFRPGIAEKKRCALFDPNRYRSSRESYYFCFFFSFCAHVHARERRTPLNFDTADDESGWRDDTGAAVTLHRPVFSDFRTRYVRFFRQSNRKYYTDRGPGRDRISVREKNIAGSTIHRVECVYLNVGHCFGRVSSSEGADYLSDNAL